MIIGKRQFTVLYPSGFRILRYIGLKYGQAAVLPNPGDHFLCILFCQSPVRGFRYPAERIHILQLLIIISRFYSNRINRIWRIAKLYIQFFPGNARRVVVHTVRDNDNPRIPHIMILV